MVWINDLNYTNNSKVNVMVDNEHYMLSSIFFFI